MTADGGQEKRRIGWMHRVAIVFIAAVASVLISGGAAMVWAYCVPLLIHGAAPLFCGINVYTLCNAAFIGAMMAEAAIHMVTESLDAFVKKDLDTAFAVIDYDDIVDNLFISVKSDLIALIRLDGANGEQAIDLIMIAKHLERIADHAVNIARWVVFSLTGKHIEE